MFINSGMDTLTVELSKMKYYSSVIWITYRNTNKMNKSALIFYP